MNLKLASSGLLTAALLVGCSSAPQLPLPSGQWDDMNLPPPIPSARASTDVPMVTTPNSVVNTVNSPIIPVAPKPASVVSVPPTTHGMAGINKAQPTPSVAPTKVFPSTPAPAPTIVNVIAAPLSPSKPVDPPFPTIAGLALSKSEVVQTPASVKVASAPAIKPVIPKPVLERWEITASDGTLRRALGKWSARSGWQLVWEASVDVPVTANATFTGDFNTVVTLLFQSLSAADVNLSAVLYSGNRVLRVTESGRRAQ